MSKFYVIQDGTVNSVFITRVAEGRADIIAEVSARAASKLTAFELAEKLRTLLNTTGEA
jgi:hypothetical protein